MEIIIATLGIALLSLIGMFFFGDKGHLDGTHRFIVPFAVGSFLAIAFFELIPETLEASGFYGSVAIVGGFLLFYLVSNILHTYHHHHACQDGDDHCSATRVSALLLLWGDFVHNATDGVVVASAFLINPAVGWVAALGIALHEIPQEIAEFGVLRSAGYSRTKAAVLNFISASGIFLGAILALLFATYFASYMWILLGIAAGNLLYVAASDLLPGVHREAHIHGTFIGSFIATLLGVVFVGVLIGYSHIYIGHPEHSTHDEHEESVVQQILHVDDVHDEQEYIVH